ncbi:MAG: diacylglycerol kinase family protein [candidate division Zixibacteria bacterium]|nr:diacylglycerol kinase family protein [candidate division Zixibacteria bacterium]
MNRPQGRNYRPPYQPVFYLVLNHRRPTGIIACGGDGTVSTVAQHLIRRFTGLGIFPLGRFNNIYRSLYGEPDIARATEHILSHQSRRIDHGLASGRFFLGSIGLGLIPELFEIISHKGMPHFAISLSRYAAQAAAAVTPMPLSVKIDAFQFDLTPLIININLLPYSIGLPLTPSSIDDDGKGEVIFDFKQGKSILSSFIRHLYKRKYIYSDEIRMFRGERISISPVLGKKLYIDGEIIEHQSPTLDIEIFEKKIIIFQKVKK